MSSSDYDDARRGGAGGAIVVTFSVLIFLGLALSAAAFIFADQELTVVESIGAGFGGVAGIILGLVGAVIGVVVGLFGALLGVIAAGGAVALTLFIVGSPIIAIILIVLLMRRRSTDCPDPDVHRE
ncbi:MAG: hypothetical protein AAFW81_07785 [Pseudomonadota bacterium]